MAVSKAELALRHMRQRIFDYPPEKGEQADRVLRYLIKRMLRERTGRKAATGPYSGLTRDELARTGTCEPDWF